MAIAKLCLSAASCPGLILDHPLDVSKSGTCRLEQSNHHWRRLCPTQSTVSFGNLEDRPKDHPAIRSGAIFEARTTEEVKAKSKELKEEKDRL